MKEYIRIKSYKTVIPLLKHRKLTLNSCKPWNKAFNRYADKYGYTLSQRKMGR